MAFLKPDGTPFDYDAEDFVSSGLNGIILRRGQHVLKIPKIRNSFKFTQEEREILEHSNRANRDSLDREKKVYWRVEGCKGLVDHIKILQDGILLQYLERGDLETYITSQAEPEQHFKANWIHSIISTILSFHRAKVLLDDIAVRNFLIAEDLSLRLIDFGQCSIFPEDTDMSTANDGGCTVQTDIFHLGCVIYSVAAWSKFECNLFGRLVRPSLEELPPVDGLFCGNIIQKCWSGHYQRMEHLTTDLCSFQ